MTEGRCMKCKKQVEIKDPENITMKNKMNAVKGVCPECGTKVFRITGKAKDNASDQDREDDKDKTPVTTTPDKASDQNGEDDEN